MILKEATDRENVEGNSRDVVILQEAIDRELVEGSS